MKSEAGTYVAEVTAIDADEGENGKLHYELRASDLYLNGANKTSGSLSPSPFSVNAQTGRVETTELVLRHNQDRFELRIFAVEDAPPNRETEVRLNVRFIMEFHTVELQKMNA